MPSLQAILIIVIEWKQVPRKEKEEKRYGKPSEAIQALCLR